MVGAASSPPWRGSPRQGSIPRVGWIDLRWVSLGLIRRGVSNPAQAGYDLRAAFSFSSSGWATSVISVCAKVPLARGVSKVLTDDFT